jgi:hypothetical protein
MARPVCLYCGAALPAEMVAAVAATAAPPPSGASARTLLVVDQSSTEPSTLGTALGLTPYESSLRQRRGGYALEGILDAPRAEEEADRLRSAGLVVFLVPEPLAREEPWLAVGGVRDEDGLHLRGASGSRQVSGPDLLVVVRGPIVREYQAPLEPRKIQATRLEDGYRVHLHLRASPQILEIDPGDFDFGVGAQLFGSSLLEMNNWLESLTRGVVMDDAFRHVTPALGPGTGPAGPLAVTSALSRRASKERKKNQATVHDNLRQFRFYSSWRGAVERARAKQE